MLAAFTSSPKRRLLQETISFNFNLMEIVVPKDLNNSELEKKILEQTSHLLGTFHSSFIKEFGTEGVVGEDKKISISKFSFQMTWKRVRELR